MKGRTATRSWVPAKAKPPQKQKVPDDVRELIDARTVQLVTWLKRLCKRPDSPRLNWPDDIHTRWHRDALYVVVVMRTPHVRPPIFQFHAARMEHAGDGRFNVAVPIRRGWKTILRNSAPIECLKELELAVQF
jgi:hypothetical protein